MCFFFNFKTSYELSTPISLKTNNKKHFIVWNFENVETDNILV